jgi:two-component system, NarL family, response regulator LiaR
MLRGRRAVAAPVSPSDVPSTLRVVVLDDDPIVRRSLRASLTEVGIETVGDTSDPDDLVACALRERPDIVLVDAHLPEAAGLAAAMRLRRELSDVRVVFLAAREEPGLGFLALRAGGSGFLSKDLDASALGRALRGVSRGEAAISRAMTAELIERLRWLPDTVAGLRPVRSPLTVREWHVLDLLCEGAGTDDIAERLKLSAETVRSHIKRMMAKLGAHSRAEAVTIAEELRHAAEADGLLLDERAVRSEFERVVTTSGDP